MMGANVLVKKVQMCNNPSLVRIDRGFCFPAVLEKSYEGEKLYFRGVSCEFETNPFQP